MDSNSCLTDCTSSSSRIGCPATDICGNGDDNEDIWFDALDCDQFATITEFAAPVDDVWFDALDGRNGHGHLSQNDDIAESFWFDALDYSNMSSATAYMDERNNNVVPTPTTSSNRWSPLGARSTVTIHGTRRKLCTHHRCTHTICTHRPQPTSPRPYIHKHSTPDLTRTEYTIWQANLCHITLPGC